MSQSLRSADLHSAGASRLTSEVHFPLGVNKIGVVGGQNLVAAPEMGPAEQDVRAGAPLILSDHVEFVAVISRGEALRRGTSDRGDDIVGLVGHEVPVPEEHADLVRGLGRQQGIGRLNICPLDGVDEARILVCERKELVEAIPVAARVVARCVVVVAPERR